MESLVVVGLVFSMLAFCSTALNNGLGLTPQMGWNSWNHFRGDITADLIMQTADALVDTGLRDLGYIYLNLDDCWMTSERDAKGNMQTAQWQFPQGMKALVDYVHSKGLKFGLYADAGLKTCAGRVGTLGYEYKDAALFAKWEVDYLKYDSCEDGGVRPHARYAIMRDALNATGRPIFYSISNWGKEHPAVWPARELANSWRTWGDIKDTWASMTAQADFNNLYADYAGPGGWNDPDMLEVGNGGMTTVEYKAHFSVWALAKAPLMIGCDVRNMSAETLAILSNKEVIAVNQDPLGVQGRRMRPFTWWGPHEVWSGPLSGGRYVLLIWNRSNRRATIWARCWEAQLPTAYFVAREIWKHKAKAKEYRWGITVSLEPHDVAMFVVTPTLQAPSCRVPLWTHPLRVFSWLWVFYVDPEDVVFSTINTVLIFVAIFLAIYFRKHVFLALQWCIVRTKPLIFYVRSLLIALLFKLRLESWLPFLRRPIVDHGGQDKD